LIRKKDGTLGAFERMSQFVGSPESHGIEYSAYLALQKRVEELERTFEFRVQEKNDKLFVSWTECERQLAEAKAREKELVEAFGKINDLCNSDLKDNYMLAMINEIAEKHRGEK
jgi:hypothetical protein